VTQNVSSQNAIMVGDAANDVLMAQNADILPVVVLTGHLNEEQAKELKVKHIINDVTDLPKVLNQLNK
jgi:phosphoglycolate phosphatase-like HAD superfamily hydrolase